MQSVRAVLLLVRNVIAVMELSLQLVFHVCNLCALIVMEIPLFVLHVRMDITIVRVIAMNARLLVRFVLHPLLALIAVLAITYILLDDAKLNLQIV